MLHAGMQMGMTMLLPYKEPTDMETCHVLQPGLYEEQFPAQGVPLSAVADIDVLGSTVRHLRLASDVFFSWPVAFLS